MTGAMYASIAGLRTHMQKLSVIGNNVANVNTAGYKTQRTIFRDAMYTTYSGGSNGTAVIGGKNPSEIGYGSQVGSIDMDMSTSTFNPSKDTDCAIDGDGFFLVGNKEVAGVIDPTNPNSFKSLTLTRVGSFYFGPDGYLTDGNNVVYGFLNVAMTDTGDSIISDQLVPIRLPRMEKVFLDEDGNQVEIPDGQDAPNEEDYVEVSYVVRYPVAYPTDETTGAPSTGGDADTAYPALKDYGDGEAEDGGNPYAFAAIEGISIDGSSGKISATLSDTKENIVIGYLALGQVTNPNGVSHVGQSYYSCGDGAGDLRVVMVGGANKDVYDVQNCTYAANQTGTGGIWTGTKKGVEYVNGSQANLGDDATLSRQAELGSSGNTLLRTGFLEGPNVDLATEISEMITTQRGYQANTRIITVTDSMLEELVNMKR